MSLTLRPENFDLTFFLKNLPDKPGVYRMYAEDGSILYIGKAKSLKNRVRSYFQKLNPRQHSVKTITLVGQIAWLDYILTDSEVEALLLESLLIKQEKPKYNILLKDDKKFPWLGISDEAYPRLFITRDPKWGGKAKYFGPYTSSEDLYETLKMVRKHFPLRQRYKPLFKNRPCINYYIGTCLGPCQSMVTPEVYREMVDQVELFLNGDGEKLLKRIDREMQLASEALNFEWAAKLRDRHQAIQRLLLSKQKIITSDETVNNDVVAYAADANRVVIVILFIRKGKFIQTHRQELQMPDNGTAKEVVSTYLLEHYRSRGAATFPAQVIVPFESEDWDFLSAWLNQPVEGKPPGTLTVQLAEASGVKNMMAMAEKNAEEQLLKAQEWQAARVKSDPTKVLLELQEALALPDLPVRMECFDISHIQGSDTVASMVVFTDGVPDKQAYRRYKVQTTEKGKPDDFKSMYEVIHRRFQRAINQEAGWAEPDLLIIDGGKGQLSSALKALNDLGVQEQCIISLAKKFEEIYLPNQPRPIVLPRNSQALFLLQQIRDEAHRFAITYHREKRSKSALSSRFDELPGVGKVTRQKLIDHFKTWDALTQATPEALTILLYPNSRNSTSPKAEALYHAIQALGH